MLNLIYKLLILFFILFAVSFFSFSTYGEEKVLDLGEIEITGEVRRPNLNLIYSRKYINKVMTLIAREELKKLEKELLKPAKKLKLKVITKEKKKTTVADQNNE